MVRDIAWEAGCEVSAEETVPELLQGEPGTPEVAEARVDLHYGLRDPTQLSGGVDVTHHHVWGVGYRAGGLHLARLPWLLRQLEARWAASNGADASAAAATGRQVLSGTFRHFQALPGTSRHFQAFPN